MLVAIYTIMPMAILKCTKKLLDELKFKPDDIRNHRQVLSSWHVNLIRVDRRKCILITHDATLYSIFLPGLKKPDFLNIKDLFGQALFKCLLNESLPQAHIELFLDDIRKIQFAKTDNRSVLGSMTDLTFQIKFTVSRSGGLSNTDIFQLNHNLNRVPMGTLSEIHAIDELKALCEKLSR
jgi:hypothetical protein